MSPASTSTRSPGRSSAEARSSIRSRSAVDQHLGHGLGPRLAQRVGLGLAAALGHRLGEVGEEDGEPEPGGDPGDEPGRVVRRRRTRLPIRITVVIDRADLDDEHHRVAPQVPRVELAERVADRGPDDRRVEEAALRLLLDRVPRRRPLLPRRQSCPAPPAGPCASPGAGVLSIVSGWPHVVGRRYRRAPRRRIASACPCTSGPASHSLRLDDRDLRRERDRRRASGSARRSGRGCRPGSRSARRRSGSRRPAGRPRAGRSSGRCRPSRPAASWRPAMPARARIGTIIRKRPISIASPSVML